MSWNLSDGFYFYLSPVPTHSDPTSRVVRFCGLMWNDVDQTAAAAFLQRDQVDSDIVFRKPEKYLNLTFEPQAKKKIVWTSQAWENGAEDESLLFQADSSSSQAVGGTSDAPVKVFWLRLITKERCKKRKIPKTSCTLNPARIPGCDETPLWWSTHVDSVAVICRSKWITDMRENLLLNPLQHDIAKPLKM